MNCGGEAGILLFSDLKGCAAMYWCHFLNLMGLPWRGINLCARSFLIC